MPWLIALSYPVWRRFQPKYTIGVIGVIFNDVGQVLLVKHVFHPKHPWGLPGGWVERRETPARAVQREIQEELSIHVEVGQLICQDVVFANHLDIAFLCTTDSTSQFSLSYELLTYGWFDTDQLPPLYPFHFNAIQSGLSVN